MSIRTQKFYVHKLYMVAISSRIFTVCHWPISTTEGNIRLFNRMTTDEITRAITPDFNVSISRSYIRFICLFANVCLSKSKSKVILFSLCYWPCFWPMAYFQSFQTEDRTVNVMFCC